MKVQVMPYRGRNERVSSGKKTLIELTDTYLFYRIKYKHRALVERATEEEEIELPFYEEGFVSKSDIAAISRNAENDIKTVDDKGNDIEVDVREVQVVSISYSGETVHFSCNTEEEAETLYKALIGWKFNINTTTNNNDNTTI